jgi:hypothetical protein
MTLHRYPEALVALAVRQVEVDGEIRWALTLDRGWRPGTWCRS